MTARDYTNPETGDQWRLLRVEPLRIRWVLLGAALAVPLALGALLWMLT